MTGRYAKHDIISLLLDAGSDPNARDTNGDMPHEMADKGEL